MKATIVIPNINGKGWLRDSIESIYAQTEQDFDLIVVDNGSTDESLEQARSYCTRPNFTLIENGRNTGFSHAVNQGIARAKSEFVVLFNNDAFAEPQWLAELIRTAETDPRIFAVQSLMIRHFDRELADDAGDYVTWMGFACKTGDGRRASRYTRTKRIFSACGGASLYRKSILDEIGGFDENFFAYFEDVDLSWRANNAGYKNVLCPAARCYHICGASTGAVKYNAFKSQQSGRNSILLPLKNEPLLMLLLNFIPLALGQFQRLLPEGVQLLLHPGQGAERPNHVQRTVNGIVVQLDGGVQVLQTIGIIPAQPPSAPNEVGIGGGNGLQLTNGTVTQGNAIAVAPQQMQRIHHIGIPFRYHRAAGSFPVFHIPCILKQSTSHPIILCQLFTFIDFVANLSMILRYDTKHRFIFRSHNSNMVSFRFRLSFTGGNTLLYSTIDFVD